MHKGSGTGTDAVAFEMDGLSGVQLRDMGHARKKGTAVLDELGLPAAAHGNGMASAPTNMQTSFAESTADSAASTSTSTTFKTKARQERRDDVTTSELMRRTRLKRARSAEKMRNKKIPR